MAERNRPRPHSRTSEETHPYTDSFEVGATNLNLDDISEEDLDNLFLDEEDKEQSVWNVPTISGLTIILVGIIYLLSEIGIWAGPDVSFLASTLPWLAGVFIILLGFGVLSWRPKRSKRKTKQAIEAATGKTKVVEEPEPKRKRRSRLTRSRRDKKIMGVCGGLADYFNIDSTLVRIAFVVGTIASGGPFILAYIALAYIMPQEPALTAEERIRIIRDS
jgi:phage shock protein C